VAESKSRPTPDFEFHRQPGAAGVTEKVRCHGSGVVHGTPEACTRWSCMRGFHGQFAWRAGVSGRLPGSSGWPVRQCGKYWRARHRRDTNDRSRCGARSWERSRFQHGWHRPGGVAQLPNLRLDVSLTPQLVVGRKSEAAIQDWKLRNRLHFLHDSDQLSFHFEWKNFKITALEIHKSLEAFARLKRVPE